MPFKTLCPAGHALAVPSRFAGRTIHCPKCGVEFAIPTAPTAEAPNTAAPVEIAPATNNPQPAIVAPLKVPEKKISESTSPAVTTTSPVPVVFGPPLAKPPVARPPAARLPVTKPPSDTPAASKTPRETVQTALAKKNVPLPEETTAQTLSAQALSAQTPTPPPEPQVRNASKTIKPSVTAEAVPPAAFVPTPPPVDLPPITPSLPPSVENIDTRNLDLPTPIMAEVANAKEAKSSLPVVTAPIASPPVVTPNTSPQPTGPRATTSEQVGTVLKSPTANVVSRTPRPNPLAFIQTLLGSAIIFDENVSRGAEPRQQQRHSLYMLGFTLIGLAIFSMVPAFLDLGDHLRTGRSPGLAAWAYAVFFVGGIQLVYATYALQIHDFSTTWVVTSVTLMVAMIYATVFGALLMGNEQSWLVQQLLLQDRLREARLWSLCVLSLTSLVAYFSGRMSVRWRQLYLQERKLAADGG